MIKYDLPRLTWEVWGMKSLSKIITFPSKPTSHNPSIPLACPADACPSRHTSPPLFPSSSSWPDQTPASERFESISLNCYTWRQIYSSVQLVKKHSLVLLIIHQKVLFYVSSSGAWLQWRKIRWKKTVCWFASTHEVLHYCYSTNLLQMSAKR